MKTSRYFFTLFILLIATVSSNTAFWSSWEIELNSASSASWELIDEDKNKTIKELQSEVKTLDLEIKTNNIKINKLKRTLKIEDFFKTDLSLEEKINLKNFLDIYNYQKEKLAQTLEQESWKLEETENIVNEVVENRKDIYKKLVPYVNKDKFSEYLEFIKQDLEILKENTGIKDDTIKKNTILKEKVETIKEKIEEHKEALILKLQELIDEKIEEKINSFKNSEKFLNLEKEQKENVVKSIMLKVDEQIEELNKLENKTSIWISKSEMYDIIKQKLQELLSEL